MARCANHEPFHASGTPYVDKMKTCFEGLEGEELEKEQLSIANKQTIPLIK
jgi:hypothetical protein